MSKRLIFLLVGLCTLFSLPAFAVDGVTLINQATVNAAGGFPYKITQPGSYKLSGNLVVSATDTNGIDIQTSNVTIDLNGFTISGQVSCTGSGAGLSCVDGFGSTFGITSAVFTSPSTPNGTTVRNGSVVGFSFGVELLGTNNRVEEVNASGNSGLGLVVSNGVVRRNNASGNGNGGISTGSSTVTENVANFNHGVGLLASGGVYGSNTLDGNGLTSVSNFGAVSQNNNGCNGIAC
jgi:hypothetical protein